MATKLAARPEGGGPWHGNPVRQRIAATAWKAMAKMAVPSARALVASPPDVTRRTHRRHQANPKPADTGLVAQRKERLGSRANSIYDARSSSCCR